MKSRVFRVAVTMVMIATLIVSSSSLDAFAATGKSYVALGDSVASGDGLNQYSDQVCKRSSNGYPAIVAKNNGLTLTNLSCSGAEIRSGLTSAQSSSAGAVVAPSQIDAAFSKGVPSVMTITIGANNMRWYDFFRYCQVASCSGSRFYQYFSSFGAGALRGVVQAELSYSLTKINYLAARQGKQPPTIYITGYYNPLSTNTSCLGSSAITAAQASWFGYQVSALNNVIQRSANIYKNVQYVPVDFSGHELCSKSPWVQSISDPAPVHPNTTGQLKIAEAVQAAMKTR